MHLWIELMCKCFGFLQADDIRFEFVDDIAKTLIPYCSDTIDISREDFDHKNGMIDDEVYDLLMISPVIVLMRVDGLPYRSDHWMWKSTWFLIWSSSVWYVNALGWPERLADVEMIGSPSLLIRSCIGWWQILTPMVWSAVNPIDW
jgi:hypothetical protein